MILHTLKMVWNRRRQNFWIVAEITVSMLVLLALAVAALSAWHRYQNPMGFDPHDIWLVNAFAQVDGAADEAVQRQADELHTFLSEHPRVDHLGMSLFRPYSGEAMTTVFTAENGRVVVTRQFFADPGFAEAADMDLVAGRWLTREDDGAGDRPVVLSAGLAEVLFNQEDPVGRHFRTGENSPNYRVVGVVRSFRWDGELSSDTHTIFMPISLERPRQFPFRTFIMEMKPESDVATEQELLVGLQARAPDWSFDLDRGADLRRRHLRNGLTPLAAAGTIAVFLILMVGLGLTGVLWQNITRRSRELGLRRAQGAPLEAIHRQIVGEVWVLTTLGMVPALIIALQLPLFDVLGSEELLVLAPAFALAAGLLYLLTTTCALYPCRMVTGQTPGEALHYE